eukprot:5474881-Pleurochrysis_carterae.AAC.1
MVQAAFMATNSPDRIDRRMHTSSQEVGENLRKPRSRTRSVFCVALFNVVLLGIPAFALGDGFLCDPTNLNCADLDSTRTEISLCVLRCSQV